MIHVLCVAYQRNLPLLGLILSFRNQTNANWDLEIMYDGRIPNDIREMICDQKAEDSRIKYNFSPQRLGNYGHNNRKKLIEDAKYDLKDFILLTNDDNYYVPAFINQVTQQINDTTGMVLFNMAHSHLDYEVIETEIIRKQIDIGSFVVRLDIAKETGFNSIEYHADYLFAKDCADLCYKKGLAIKKINKLLFIHN
jgi:hypothetical protein